MTPLDYRSPGQSEPPRQYPFPRKVIPASYRPHRPWLLCAVSILPVLLLLIFARVRTTQFQRQAGREVLIGTAQDGQFQRMTDRILAGIFVLEGLMFLTTAVMVLLEKWHPSAAWLLLVYIGVFVIGMPYLYFLGCEASP